MIYRNVYFKHKGITKGKGNVDVLYSGCIFTNAKDIKDFDKRYDRGKDLFIDCTDCASHTYRNFIKVNH